MENTESVKHSVNERSSEQVPNLFCKDCGIPLGKVFAFCPHCGDALCPKWATSSGYPREIMHSNRNIPSVYGSERSLAFVFPHYSAYDRIRGNVQWVLGHLQRSSLVISAMFLVLFLPGFVLLTSHQSMLKSFLTAMVAAGLVACIYLRSRQFDSFSNMRKELLSCWREIEEAYLQFLWGYDGGKTICQEFRELLSGGGEQPNIVFCPFRGYHGFFSYGIGLRKFVPRNENSLLEGTAWCKNSSRVLPPVPFVPAQPPTTLEERSIRS